jgi:hypothetical protein
MGKNKNNSEKNKDMICPNCGRTLTKEVGVGFGSQTKIKPCICSPFARSIPSKIGFGNF